MMGVLNLTPDSFSDGGKFTGEIALERAIQLEKDGADLLDIGAESTRPHAKSISTQEEIDRLFPVLTEILKHVKIPVSLDTTKSKIADLGLEAGVSIVNDVSALAADPKMPFVIERHHAGVILMHSRGTSESMMNLTNYHDLVKEVCEELSKSISTALHSGISSSQIAIDPGFGFAKNEEQNFELARSFSKFLEFQRPVVVGISRKSFLGKITGRDVTERDFATCAMHAFLLERGVSVIRAHDVKAAKDAISVVSKINDQPAHNLGERLR